MHLRDSIAQVTEHIYTVTEQHALAGRGVPPPTVWVFDPRLDPPLLGCAATRPFYTGVDAVRTIERLGVFPAAFAAPLVMVSWEQVDLLRALTVDDGRSPTAIITALAELRGGHQVTMRHVAFHDLGDNRLASTWGPEIELGDAELPPPIEGLLATWQRDSPDASADTAVRVHSELRAEGFELALTTQATTPRNA